MKANWLTVDSDTRIMYKCTRCELYSGMKSPFCYHCGSEMENYNVEDCVKVIVREDYKRELVSINVSNPSTEFGGCANCKHHEDPEAICIARLCIHAINELTDSYEPKEK